LLLSNLLGVPINDLSFDFLADEEGIGLISLFEADFDKAKDDDGF